MKGKSLVPIVMLVFILTVQNARGYAVECNIEPITSLDSFVSSTGFNLNITTKNLGNETFPESTWNVSIFNPNHEIPESYFSFPYTVPKLGINVSYEYSHRYGHNETLSAFFELNMPGTWEIRVDLVSLLNDSNITRAESDGIERIGQCRKYINVLSWEGYIFSKKDEQIQNKLIDLTNQMKDMTLALLAISLITVIISIAGNKEIFSRIKNYSNYIVGISGIIITIGLNLQSWDFVFTVILSVVIFFRKELTKIKKKITFRGMEIDITKNIIKPISIGFLLFMVAFSVLFFLIFYETFMIGNFVTAVIGIILTTILFFASGVELWVLLEQYDSESESEQNDTVPINYVYKPKLP